MSLLIVPIVKSSHKLAEIYFNFLKKKKFERLSMPKLDPSEKIGNVVMK